jgi:hypothetical protein
MASRCSRLTSAWSVRRSSPPLMLRVNLQYRATMANPNNVAEVIEAIRDYARAYARLQALQDPTGLIPPGDQKTGCIGEFFVYLYLKSKHPDQTIRFAGHSNKGWDLEVGQHGRERRIQTKTVSAYSKTRRLSPISAGWHELFIVYLSRDLLPEGFWIVTDPGIVPGSGVLRHCSSPHPTGRHAGTAAIPFGKNRIDELNAVWQCSLETQHPVGAGD